MEDTFLSISELAEHFQVTTVTVRNWIKNGNVKTAERWEHGKRPFTVASLEDIEDHIHPAILAAAEKMAKTEQ